MSIPDNEHLMKFFRAHQAKFPRMQRIAEMVLNAPTSSSEIERAFSISKMTLTDRRNRLLPTKLEQIMQMQKFLKHVKKM